MTTKRKARHLQSCNTCPKARERESARVRDPWRLASHTLLFATVKTPVTCHKQMSMLLFSLLSSHKLSKNLKISLSDIMPSTRLLPASTMNTRRTPSNKIPKTSRHYSSGSGSEGSNTSSLQVPADSPGLASRSITFSKGSDRRHIWHL